MTRKITLKGIKRKADLVCIKCSIPFKAHHKDRKFCSQKCADAYRYVPKLRKGHVKICIYCKSDFYVSPSKKFQVFCSEECYIKHVKEKSFRFNCIICGKEVLTQPAQMKYRNRKTCSIDCRSIYQTEMAEKRRIENPPTPGLLNRRIRYSKKMALWRLGVFTRDDYTCQICGARNGHGKTIILHADHIKPFALFPELRFELSNGRTLCISCHKKTDTFGRKPIYAKKINIKVNKEQSGSHIQ